MKGLLYKELITLKKSSVILIIFTIFFGFLSFIVPSFSFSIITMPLLMNIDIDRRLVATMPYDRKTVVSAKYVYLLILTAIISTFIALMYTLSFFPFSFNHLAFYFSISATISLVYSLISMPLYFRFISNDTATLISITFIFSSIISGLIAMSGVIFLLDLFNDTAKPTAKHIIISLISLAVVLILFDISRSISVKFYEKRDL